MFIKVRELCFKVTGKGGKEALLTRMASMMPGKTIGQIKAHEQW